MCSSVVRVFSCVSFVFVFVFVSCFRLAFVLFSFVELDTDRLKYRLMMIDHFVSRGSHFVECQLLGEEGQSVPMFKLLGILST